MRISNKYAFVHTQPPVRRESQRGTKRRARAVYLSDAIDRLLNRLKEGHY